MGTAIDRDHDPEHGELEPHRALLDHPQLLGILPTMWFWQDKSNWRLIRWPFVAILWVAIAIVVSFDFPLWVVGVTVGGTLMLILGLIERYIRTAAKRRLRSRPEPPALTHASED